MRSTINNNTIIATIDGQLNISESRKLGFLTDVVLNASNMKQYPAHKLILSIASDYFRALFTGRFTQVTEVDLTEFEAQTVELYLNMIYGERIVLHDW